MSRTTYNAFWRDEQPVAKSASELLSDLERHGLVPPQVAASLKSQVANAAQPVSAQSVADLLVQKGLLTPAQRESLLAPKASTTDLFDDVEPLEAIDSLETASPLESLGNPLGDSFTDPLAVPVSAVDPLAAGDPLATPQAPQTAAPTQPAAATPPAPKGRSLLWVGVSLLVLLVFGGG
ncbi:MAG: hypothetical protein MUF06_14965, partial [Pirellulaceae bacterium]|nr:hypothetical protein [Pirellulaceae bacterium]